jgi:hypothetical protein
MAVTLIDLVLYTGGRPPGPPLLRLRNDLRAQCTVCAQTTALANWKLGCHRVDA